METKEGVLIQPKDLFNWIKVFCSVSLICSVSISFQHLINSFHPNMNMPEETQLWQEGKGRITEHSINLSPAIVLISLNLWNVQFNDIYNNYFHLYLHGSYCRYIGLPCGTNMINKNLFTCHKWPQNSDFNSIEHARRCMFGGHWRGWKGGQAAPHAKNKRHFPERNIHKECVVWDIIIQRNCGGIGRPSPYMSQ